MTQERYDIIADHLRLYKRRFTLLDLGAGIDTKISKVISNNFNCVAVVVERDVTDLEGYGSHSIILKHDFSSKDLELLGDCEHFDVVLALNFLHHFSPDTWEPAARAVMNMGDAVFIQLPNIEEITVPGNEFLPQLWQLVRSAVCYEHVANTVQFPGHPARPLIKVDNAWRPKMLTRTHLDAHLGSAETFMTSDFERIGATMKKGGKSRWIPGINLWNFCRLGGVLPSRKRIVSMLQNYPRPATNHGDIVPWNFILDGDSLHLIDGFEGWEFDDRENMNKTINMVRETLCI